jgi:hypothetical protein
MELVVFQDIGDMRDAMPYEGRTANRGEGGGRNKNGSQNGRTILSVLELDVTAGSEVVLHCSLSASGLLNLRVGHDGAMIEMPLFLPKEPKNEFLTELTDVNEERLRKAKLRIASAEPLLSEVQKDRLYSVLRLLKNSESDPAAAEMLEKLAQELEFALS